MGCGSWGHLHVPDEKHEESGRMLAITCRFPEERIYAAECEEVFYYQLRDAMTHSVTP